MLDKLQKIPAKRLAGAALRNARPSHLNLWRKDFLWSRKNPNLSAVHLRETFDWLKHAHDACGGKGVSGGYSVIDGWLPPYPETTGYIIPTFYDYAEWTGTDEWWQRAEAMAEWEIEVQMPNGAVQAGLFETGKEQIPAVFNTGQVILGWCRAYTEAKEEKYLQAATRAGDWLISVQADDGSWKFESQETETNVHAYDVRTAWSLLEIYDITKEEKYRQSAEKQIDWTLLQQKKNGWFENNAFFTSADKWTAPFTHTIAYVCEGLQEAYRILGKEEYFTAYEKTAKRLMRIFELRRFMAGDFNEKWRSSSKYSCLTGNAQIAGIWLKLFQTNSDVRYLNAALKLN
ncbi:MAG: hypothetical protein HKN25_07155, partial [Pyrinomonadaceae bacterium]|nr:hypothetical protein [Pyrinomonadaceae bacterium]